MEHSQAKAKRKAARQESSVEPVVPSHRSEAELMEDLAALQRALEVGDVSPEEFEERRHRIRAQLEQHL